MEEGTRIGAGEEGRGQKHRLSREDGAAEVTGEEGIRSSGGKARVTIPDRSVAEFSKRTSLGGYGWKNIRVYIIQISVYKYVCTRKRINIQIF